MAPISASVMPTFMPANRLGSACGKRILSSVLAFDAFIERARSIISGSTERSPSTMSMTMTKMAIMVAMATLGDSPVPHPHHEQGRDRDLGDAVEGDQQDVEGLLQEARGDDQDRQHDPEDHGEDEADDRLQQRVPGVRQHPQRIVEHRRADHRRRGTRNSRTSNRTTAASHITSEPISTTATRMARLSRYQLRGISRRRAATPKPSGARDGGLAVSVMAFPCRPRAARRSRGCAGHRR